MALATSCPALHAALKPRVERSVRTLGTEWAHGRTWPSTATQPLAGILDPLPPTAAESTPSLGDRPPVNRVHRDHGQDS